MKEHLVTLAASTPRLNTFLAFPRAAGESVEQFCARLAHRLGEDVFAEAILYLSHIRLPCAEAHRHWVAIIEHRETLCALAERDIGLLTAVVDYFTSVCPLLDSPVTLEAETLAQCQRLMMLDDLTGLYNRRYFTAELHKEIQRSRRLNQPMALLMADIDHFKKFNDTYGHAAGDTALASVGKTMRESARLMDQAIRYGGEEFAFILPHTSKGDAFVVAERLRIAMQNHTPRDAAGDPLPPVTLSIGLAACPDDGDEPIALIEAADRALYRAKGQGRNQTCTQSDDLRRGKRLPVPLNVRCLVSENNSPAVMAQVLDLSAWGVRCELSSALKPGKRLSLVLQDDHQTLKLPVHSAQTVWAQTVGEGVWRTGIAFNNLTTPQRRDLQALLDNTPLPNG